MAESVVVSVMVSATVSVTMSATMSAMKSATMSASATWVAVSTNSTDDRDYKVIFQLNDGYAAPPVRAHGHGHFQMCSPPQPCLLDPGCQTY